MSRTAVDNKFSKFQTRTDILWKTRIERIKKNKRNDSKKLGVKKENIMAAKYLSGSSSGASTKYFIADFNSNSTAIKLPNCFYYIYTILFTIDFISVLYINLTINLFTFINGQ